MGVFLAVFLPFFLEAIEVICDSVSESDGTFFRFCGGLLLMILTGWAIERLESDEG